MRNAGEVLNFLPQAVIQQMDKPLKSATHGQCDARPTVTSPAAGRHRLLTGTKLYCLVTESRVCVCEQLAQGCYLKAQRPGLESATESKRTAVCRLFVYSYIAHLSTNLPPFVLNCHFNYLYKMGDNTLRPSMSLSAFSRHHNIMPPP